MLRFIALLLSCLLIAAPALADLPLPEMATEDLTALRDAISLELAGRSASADALAAWDTSIAHVELISVTRGTTDQGQPGVDLCFRYTNTGADVDSFMSHHWIRAYHDGVECPNPALIDGRSANSSTWMSKVFPGRTLQEMHWFFTLTGSEPTIMVEVEDRSAFPWHSAGYNEIALP